MSHYPAAIEVGLEADRRDAFAQHVVGEMRVTAIVTGILRAGVQIKR